MLSRIIICVVLGIIVTGIMPGFATPAAATARLGSSSPDYFGRDGTGSFVTDIKWVDPQRRADGSWYHAGWVRTGISEGALTSLDGPVIVDSIGDNAVLVRLVIPTPNAVERDLLVSGRIAGEGVDKTRSFFEEWYQNQLRVISMDEQLPWGQTVGIAAKVDLTGMDAKNLCVYSYDKARNQYTRITTGHSVDQNNYLCFTTPYAGDIGLVRPVESAIAAKQAFRSRIFSTKRPPISLRRAVLPPPVVQYDYSKGRK